jgi:hypothetical protein
MPQAQAVRLQAGRTQGRTCWLAHAGMEHIALAQQRQADMR